VTVAFKSCGLNLRNYNPFNNTYATCRKNWFIVIMENTADASISDSQDGA